MRVRPKRKIISENSKFFSKIGQTHTAPTVQNRTRTFKLVVDKSMPIRFYKSLL